jgi:hypothetical protein
LRDNVDSRQGSLTLRLRLIAYRQSSAFAGVKSKNVFPRHIEMRSRRELIRHTLGNYAVSISQDGIEFLELPTVTDGAIHELLECAKRLPDDMCLFLDGQAGKIRFFQVLEALGFYGCNCGVIENLAVTGARDNPHRKFSHARHQQPTQGAVVFPIGKLIIHRPSISQNRRFEQHWAVNGRGA